MKRIVLAVVSLLLVASCSTTKLLPDGTYRLVSNKVTYTGDEKLSANEVTPYIRQHTKRNSLFVAVYNWSDGSGKGINRLWEKIGAPPVVFDPLKADDSRGNIAGHLESLGYFGSQVDTLVTYRGRKARVQYLVSLGRRYPIDRIVFDVPGGEFGQAFHADSANVTVRPGDFLSEKSLEAESVRGAAFFRNLGYYDFNKNHYFFEADTLTPGHTTLYYRIRPYSRSESPLDASPLAKYRIGDVHISYPAEIPFRESLLRDMNTIRPGMVYSERMVNTTYTRLSTLKLFNSVNVEMTPADSAVVDCDIRLGGTDLLGFKANVEASTNSSGLIGFSPQLTFYHKNIFHGGEWLNLGFSGNWQWQPNTGARTSEFGISASLSFPRLLGFKMDRLRGSNVPRTEIKTSFNYQNRPEYRRSLASLNYGFSGQMGRNTFYQIYPLQLNLVKLYAISADFMDILLAYPYLWSTFEDHIDAGVGVMLYHTTNSDVVPKTAYHYERVNLDLSGNVLSLLNPILPMDDYEVFQQRLIGGLPYKQYVRMELTLGRVLRFGWDDRQALAMRLVGGLGIAYGNSAALPFEKQFYCGGASSMRGWQSRTLGPGYEGLSDYFMIPSQTGALKLEADLEYRFPLFWKLEGALFAEVGNVWDVEEVGQLIPKVDLPGSLAADWGLGVRVNLDFILLRVDAGFKVHDPSREAGSRWLGPRNWFGTNGFAIHFGVGYPF